MATVVARLLLTISIFISLEGCTAPTEQDVIGQWASKDGGSLILRGDSTFVARQLPRKIFFDLEHGDVPVDGTGNWQLEKRNAYWEVSLSFRGLPEYPGGYGTSVLVAGDGNSTELFRWVEDQGGERYELEKQSLR